jgi:ABC-type Fe3+/spermidine/putrescine transport system ATPase subunit
MIFQDLGLWPHMSVSQHLAFALRAQGVRRDGWSGRIDPMLDAVGLSSRKSSRPGTLSGGERQRLAIARALVTQPRIVLFDEPLASIDVVLRDELLELFRNLLRAHGATAVCVTHDLTEALALTEEIGVLEQGRLIQRGPIAALRQAPASPFVQKLVTHKAATS